jgi:alkanesulfonate monooxygenase SsuD/methylene tetrahydromethanopterin reductase-like flavin-dependent oxidoreductase (luciferase family)
VRARIDHCIAVAEQTRRMLGGDGMDQPRPVQDPVPLLIGGGNTRLLGWAAGHADLIGLSGLGRTLDDGHRHEVRWRPDQVDAQVELTGGKPVEALVQLVQVTDDAGAVYAEWGKDGRVTEDDLAAAPYVLVGTIDEIAAKIGEVERRWGITRFAVRTHAIDAVEALRAPH